MPNLGDLKALIARDLRRSNLGPEIADAIPDAIRDHETARYWFNETFPRPYTLIVSPAGSEPLRTLQRSGPSPLMAPRV